MVVLVLFALGTAAVMPPEAQTRASRWYDRANRISQERAEEVGAHRHASAGSYAALSPQKDWVIRCYRWLGRQASAFTNRISQAGVTLDLLRQPGRARRAGSVLGRAGRLLHCRTSGRQEGGSQREAEPPSPLRRSCHRQLRRRFSLA